MLKIRIATRGSRLARVQSESVAQALRDRYDDVEVELQIVRTEGDRLLDTPLHLAGGKGLFTRAVDEALLAGDADVAVHSLKDLPTEPVPGIELAAVPERESDRDMLVMPREDADVNVGIPEGVTVATGSLRRRAQLLAQRPDLKVADLRGNVESRLAKVRQQGWFGTILAEAGLNRLGLSRLPRMPLAEMLPAAAQGALGITVRVTAPEILERVRALNHPSSHARVTAERSFLHALGAGCHAPVGVRSHIEGATLQMEGAVFSVDGSRQCRVSGSGQVSDAPAVGEVLAKDVRQQDGAIILSEGVGDA